MVSKRLPTLLGTQTDPIGPQTWSGSELEHLKTASALHRTKPCLRDHFGERRTGFTASMCRITHARASEKILGDSNTLVLGIPSDSDGPGDVRWARHLIIFGYPPLRSVSQYGCSHVDTSNK